MKIAPRLAHAIALAVALGLATVYRFAPGDGSFYPPCIFARLTGWQCPGCGSTRALYALLHLHFAAAMALNPLFTLGFPLLALWALAQYFSALKRGRMFEVPLPRHAYPAMLAVSLAFGILRNMPIGGLR